MNREFFLENSAAFGIWASQQTDPLFREWWAVWNQTPHSGSEGERSRERLLAWEWWVRARGTFLIPGKKYDIDEMMEEAMRRLGLICGECWGGAKWIFWSNNSLGNALCGLIGELIRHHILTEEGLAPGYTPSQFAERVALKPRDD